MTRRLLEVRDLATHFFTRAGVVRAVDGVSFEVHVGQVLGLVGESGSGKTVTGYSILGLVDPPGRIVAGSISFEGRELTALAPEELRVIRGRRISMVFQDATATLNPVLSVGDQMLLAARAHERVSERAARTLCLETLAKVGIPDPVSRFRAYPHQLSGGMRQRVGLARALAVDADILLMDEPFASVDEQTRRKFQEDLLRLRERERKTFIFVTHSIEEAVYLSDQIVMLSRRPGRLSRIVEPRVDRTGTPDEIRRDPHYLDTVEEIWQVLREYVD